MEKSKELEKARAYAFLLLKYRLRSRQELVQRLRRKKFSEDVIDRVVGFLAEKRFIDDRAFAKAWTASRAGQKFGAGRIRRELRLKGIAPELIEEELRTLGDSGCEEETIRAIAEEKLGKLKDVDPRTAKRRIFAYFIRRGFSPDAVIDTLNGLID